MPMIRKNQDNIDLFRTYFYSRKEPNAAWFHAMGAYQMLTGLRGFWPMSAFDENGGAFDLSGNGRTLTPFNTPDFKNVDLIPCVDLTRASNQYQERANEAGIQIIGNEGYVLAANQGLTCGGWYRFDAIGNQEGLISKWIESGDQRSYRLIKDAANTITFQISTSGTVGTVFTETSTATVSTGEWYFLAGRFDPATQLDVWVNATQSATATGLAGTIFNSSATLKLGSTDTGNYHGGEESLVFLCAAYLPDYIVAMIYEHTRSLFGI